VYARLGLVESGVERLLSGIHVEWLVMAEGGATTSCCHQAQAS
jgi:hypothetical protein